MPLQDADFTPLKLQSLIPDVLDIARGAGAILRDYFTTKSYVTEIKEDGSPVTTADYDSHKFIKGRLEALTPGVPVISEENETQPDLSGPGPFWTVDPNDGTDNFRNGSHSFYVKIALIKNGEPLLGAVYVPMIDTMFYSWEGGPAFRQDGRNAPVTISARKADTENPAIIGYKNYHLRPAFQKAAEHLIRQGFPLDVHNTVRGTVIPPYLQLAQGEADIYLNCGKTENLLRGNGYSWDYAPDWLILKNAGGTVREVLSGARPVFDKPADPMNALVGFGDPRLAAKLGNKADPKP